MPIPRSPGQSRPPIVATHSHWLEHILDADTDDLWQVPDAVRSLLVAPGDIVTLSQGTPTTEVVDTIAAVGAVSSLGKTFPGTWSGSAGDVGEPHMQFGGGNNLTWVTYEVAVGDEFRLTGYCQADNVSTVYLGDTNDEGTVSYTPTRYAAGATFELRYVAQTTTLRIGIAAWDLEYRDFSLERVTGYEATVTRVRAGHEGDICSIVDGLPAWGGGVALPSLAADPANPRAGQVYLNTVSHKLKFYTGSAWETLTSS